MAYTTCTVGEVARGDDGGVLDIKLVFTGDAGEPVRTVPHVPGTGTKAEELLRAQQERDRILTMLNNKKALADAGGLVKGLVIGPAPAAGGPSADELAATAWRKKFDQLAVVEAAKVVPTGAFATQIDAIRLSINTDFNAANGALKTAMGGKL